MSYQKGTGRSNPEVVGSNPIRAKLSLIDPWGLTNFLKKGSNPVGFGVSAVLPTTGALTIKLHSFSIKKAVVHEMAPPQNYLASY